MKKILICLAIFCAFSAEAFARKANVVIIATGGTIAGTAASSSQATYSPAQLMVDQILETVPGVKKLANISSIQFSQISSQNMTDELWLKLAKTVNETLSKSSVDGIVITHGTDTIEETAYFLNLVVKSRKPVVIVGSMRPSSSLSADGPLNLFNAIATAANPVSKNKGVLVVFNDNIYAARDVSKINTTNVAAFASNNSGPIGMAYYGDVKFYYSPLRTHTADTVFDVRKLTKLPKVEIVYAHVNHSSDVIDNMVSDGVAGIVTAGVGDGNVNEKSLKSLIDASTAGVLVTRSSRLGSGFVVLNNEIEDDRYGFVTADNLNPQKARILLMLALTKTNDYKKIREMFGQY